VDRSFRLVAVDLDGTLLSSNRTIAEADKRALAACADAGVAVAVVTGRRLPSARVYVDTLPIEPFVVANSGAIIHDRGRIVRRSLLSVELALEVLDIAAGVAIEPVVHDGPDGEGHLILREVAKELPHVGRYLNQTIPPPIWVSSIALERDPVQIGFASGLAEIRELAALLSKALSEVSVIKTEYPSEDLALLDVLSADANKSMGLKFLSRHTSVPMSKTLAIGDNWNDVDMLEAAGLGVVMANAVDELKALGFTLTASNDDNGVAKAIHRYVLNR
jgi:Cof subfamily protein (haloacid dehalogenase superfamily)